MKVLAESILCDLDEAWIDPAELTLSVAVHRAG
jgi:hypothetical protein